MTTADDDDAQPTGAQRELHTLGRALTRLRAPDALPVQPSRRPPLPSLSALRLLYTRSEQVDPGEAPAPPTLSIGGAPLDVISLSGPRPLQVVAANDKSTSSSEHPYTRIQLITPADLAAYGLDARNNHSDSSDPVRKALARFERDWGMPRHERRLTHATVDIAARLNAAADDFPHLTPLVRRLASETQLLARAQMPLQFRPILLVGQPGLGKTYALSRIAAAAGLPMQAYNMTLMPSAFAWFGSHRTWNGATCGVIARRLIETPTANPIILVDEFDKANTASTNDRNPYAAFYPLLERETAAKFVDEFLGFEIDASHISWIFSANDLSNFPQPILDRLEIIQATAPTAGVRLKICRSIYEEVNAYYLHAFDREPSEEFLEALPQGSFRGVRRSIERAMAQAATQDRTAVIASDLQTPEGRRSQIALI